MQIELIDVVRRMVNIANLQLTRLAPPFEELHHFDFGLRDAIDPAFDWQAMGQALLEAIPDRAMILIEDTFGMEYLGFRLPDEAEDHAYIVGPWRHPHSPDEANENRRWLLHRTSEDVVRLVEDYFDGVTALEDEGIYLSAMTSLLSLAYPHVEGREDYHLEVLKEFLPLNIRPDTRSFSVPTFEQDVSMPMIEERYHNEAEMMDAATAGDADRLLRFYKERRRFQYSGDRFRGSVEEERNALIIFNVLLRKSIERAQVHPYYIDQLSARFYQRIRSASSDEINPLTLQMISEYCRYAREYSMRQYSPLIRNTITYIQLNLSAPLSLRVLAEQFFISPSYLSNLFRSEVGVTLVDYISTSRMKRAAGLLTETNLSITAIAEQVGIVDVNYFAKLFKKSYQMTPTLYRRTSREQNAKLKPEKS